MSRSPLPLPTPELETGRDDPEAATRDQAIREILRAAIGALPEQRRTAFHLADVEGYSTEETARIMGLTPGTVRSHIHHARRVREFLEQMHPTVLEALEAGPDSLLATTQSVHQRLLELLPPEARPRFRRWLQQH